MDVSELLQNHFTKHCFQKVTLKRFHGTAICYIISAVNIQDEHFRNATGKTKPVGSEAETST